MQKELSRLKEITRKIYLLHHAAALLGWDQETNMPPAGVDERGEQLAVLEGYLHRTATDPEIGDLLSAVGADDHQPMGPPELPDGDRRFLRFLYRQYSREVKLPESLVTEIARVSSKSMAVWNEARKKNQFDLFAPYLEKLLGLAVEKAKCIGYVENPYDPLLDEYEPWMKTAEAARVFSQLKGELATLLKEIRGAEQVREDFLRLPYRVEDQNLFAPGTPRRPWVPHEPGKDGSLRPPVHHDPGSRRCTDHNQVSGESGTVRAVQRDPRSGTRLLRTRVRRGDPGQHPCEWHLTGHP